ncbi:unnamed protein product [Coregonus sp. 'balchen']|nr:unnamed protein product [Coregonus sp. 'balchen']
MRWDYVISKMQLKYTHFPRREPTARQVEIYIEWQNWEKNKVKVEDVLRYWQPSSKTDNKRQGNYEAGEVPEVERTVHCQ